MALRIKGFSLGAFRAGPSSTWTCWTSFQNFYCSISEDLRSFIADCVNPVTPKKAAEPVRMRLVPQIRLLHREMAASVSVLRNFARQETRKTLNRPGSFFTWKL